MQTAQPNYFPALTGVRALAAYLVFISHYDYVGEDIFPAWLTRFFHEFHIGVTVFFVLSGFLITYRYYNNFQLTGNWFRKYLKNRVARIYPMYFLLTTAAFVYWYFTKDPVITKNFPSPFGLYLMNVFFVRGFFSQLWDTGIAQGWSLTVEECFYFSAPFIFYLAAKFKRLYVQPVIITAFGVLLVLIFRNVNWYGLFGNFTFMMLYTFFGRCFEFFVGMFLALQLLNKGFGRTNNIRYTYIGFVSIFALVAVMSRLPIPDGAVAGLQHPVGIILNNYFIAAAIALFFYGLLTEDTSMKSALALPFVELLGKASYIFYLIHLGYIYIFFHNWFDQLNEKAFNLYDKWGVDWPSPFQFGLLNLLYGFIILNIISIILFKFIEEPLNHYIRKSRFLESRRFN
ncbi:acyltransferase family protein [Mucilaginibacter myungsuensis]|uniref:Acyltransferase n=1 Tax=Mucilaginibacter myungsuensis TaxID=649104 RepID=A0A929L0D2_9SPHI|nr:acyltransferase [Mucilaginibacter myungsuensis]MBE9660976.1 acyltransferase [Mucilaginibacter myungsuensis]MDN3601022.1 acyltransferase [Mucilaginibacter myungsuensis]